jgi:hypothetical protein
MLGPCSTLNRPGRGLPVLALGALLVGLAPAARADGQVSVSTELSPPRASVGDQVTLVVTIKISGPVRSGGILGGEPFDAYQPPGLKDLEVGRQWTSQSTQISIVGGRAQREVLYQYHYLVTPRRAGTLTIAPASVTYQGKVVRSNPVTLAVGTGPAAPPPHLPGQAPNLTGTEDLFVQVVPDKVKAYVGEQVTVTWYLYARTNMPRSPSLKTVPSTDSFFAEDLPFASPQVTRTTIGGETYAVVPIFRKALFPLKPGQLIVGPLTVEAMTVSSSYFSLTPVERSSAELAIEALPVPTAGVPPGFHAGNVGRFTVTAEVEPAQVDATSATSLRVTVEGTGYLHGIKVDRLEQIDGFKVRFAGQKTELGNAVTLGGKRIHEYVLIPVRTGTVPIPPVCFPHFDPEAARFVTDACSRPLSVTVSGTLPAAAAAVTAGASAQENELRAQLKPILQPPRLHDRRPWRLHRTPWLFWLAVLLPPLAFLATLGVRRLRESLLTDTEGRRLRLARGRVRARLRQAVRHLKAGQRVAFFTEIARVLEEHLTASLGVRVQGLTTPDLRAVLHESGIPVPLQERLVRELEMCDFARFAPAASAEEEMEVTLLRTREILADLDRAAPRRAAPAPKAPEVAP